MNLHYKVQEADDITKKQWQMQTLADDLALLTKTPVEAEYWLHNLAQAAGNIGLYVTSDNIEFMRFI